MKAVLCLPACSRVSAAASRGQAPHGNASVPTHPTLGMLNSIFSLIQTFQIAFFWVQTNTISVTHPPPNGAKNWFFHLVSPAGHFRYPAPLI